MGSLMKNSLGGDVFWVKRLRRVFGANFLGKDEIEREVPIIKFFIVC